MGTEEDAKLELFLQWLQVNNVELRGCQIKYCGPDKGFGIFSSNDSSDNGIPLVVPLDLAITPMRVLQDPLIGPECRAMFEEGEVDDRFLIMLFLMVERLRKNSSWNPYFDMLPTSFGNPLWFSDDELLELKGTILHRATKLQKKKLVSLFNDKVRDLVKKLLILDGHPTGEVHFEDFLWANSVFWTRALNIPLPRSYVFPQAEEDESNQISINKLEICCDDNSSAILSSNKEESGFIDQADDGGNTLSSGSIQGETVWVEGLVPGIDFCNHSVKATATWEVDATGSHTGVPSSMYLLYAEQTPLQDEREIFISYGNKGNEELLYLYGFAVDNNPDDFLMVHYPFEAINNVPFSVSKLQLLESQKAEMQCLLPRSLLESGFFPEGLSKTNGIDKNKVNQACNYSWSGQRRIPSYVNKLVVPADFLSALRTIAMREDELFTAASLLEELVGPERERHPTENEVKAAIWEAAGDSGALQLLVDLLQTKMMDLEEGSGTEDHDSELLEKLALAETTEQQKSGELKKVDANSRNKRNSIIYRKGQKQLTRLFLREAEHALQLSLREGN